MTTTIKRNKKKATPAKKKWSGPVTKNSHALALESGVFKLKDPKKIAASLRRSSEKSKNRKSGSFRSAMSMLNFYINRGGKNLNEKQKDVLEKAKNELRSLYKK